MWDFEIDPDGDIIFSFRKPNAVLIIKPMDAIKTPSGSFGTDNSKQL